MLRILLMLTILLGGGATAHADDLLTLPSPRPVGETLDRLQAAVVADGFFLVGRVPHSEAAERAGLSLRPTALLIFGKPQGGTPIMVCDQRAGNDLPLRALAWQDAAGRVWLAMNDPLVLKRRYDLPAACDAPLAAMAATVRRLLDAATAP